MNLVLIIALALLAALAVLQILGAAGLPVGSLLWGGRERVLPTRLRLSSLATLAAYAVFAALLLSRTGVLPGRDSTVVIVATWVLVGVLALSTVANAVSGSRTERATMVPTGAVLTVAVLVIALGW